jgi:predicted amidophosphoribosyltransferase
METIVKKNEREYKTIQKMINIFCRGQHNQKARELCPSCRELLSYAESRLAKCPYAENKPTCARCPIHCYKPDMRRQIRAVMRYAGPRMMRYHPVLSIRHLLDGWKTKSQR